MPRVRSGALSACPGRSGAPLLRAGPPRGGPARNSGAPDRPGHAESALRRTLGMPETGNLKPDRLRGHFLSVDFGAGEEDGVDGVPPCASMARLIAAFSFF